MNSLKIKNLKLKISAYNPSEIESKWQERWQKEKVYSPDMDKAGKPFYNLMMFPYPSAEGLHVGNMYAFTGSDIYGRYKRMQGYNVFEPIGLDGFGIHSENYAIKVGKHPKEQAARSQVNFYRQLRSIGNGFDFTRTVETYNPDYYHWTQWIFVQLFKQGLAYRKKSPVNFCPSCKTVLADEQVIDGKCERCSSVVEKRDLEQWFFKITEYAERLLAGLETIDWADKVKIAQKAWIGKKEGINISYPIEGTEHAVEVFTTRPDTNFGATFIALAPEHPLLDKLSMSHNIKVEVEKYRKATTAKSEQDRIAQGREKTGVFTGFYAVNQLTGFKMPIWVSDFVLSGFGTGALVGVPGHDKRDFEFAIRYGLEIKRVVGNSGDDQSLITSIDQVQEESGVMVNSDFLNGLDIHEATKKIMDYLEEKGFGKKVIQFHLRDWLISRQRYWGPPIPMIFCPSCAQADRSYFSTQSGELLNQPQNEAKMLGWFPVKDDQLPVLLPDVEDWRPVGSGSSPLASHPEFYETTCPECGGKAKRETDVSDTFLDSAWYFFRYTSTEEKSQAWSPERAKKWLPVDMYIGGAEHSVLHLLYSRFLTMVFHDLGLSDFEEPFTRFYAHGLIIKDGSKMSKSKGNVVVPDEYISKFGADTLRSYLMFTGPYNMGGDFRDSGVEGMSRFLNRVWRLVSEATQNQAELKTQNNAELDVLMHKTIKAVTEDMDNLRYNTTIAHLMTYYNGLSEFYTKYKILNTKYCKTLVLLLAPFAPHMTEELWEQLGEKGSIHVSAWPTFDASAIKTDLVTYAVQINGKVRETLDTSSALSKEEVQKLAEELENVTRFLSEKKIKNVIFVPGKIINFVLE